MTAPRKPVSQIALSNVTKRYDDHLVLDRLDLTVDPGTRVGVIGDNGSGKSTLLRLIAGLDAPDNGEVLVSAPGGTAYLPQGRHAEKAPLSATVADAIDTALADLRDLETRLHEAESALSHTGNEELDYYGDLLMDYEARDGYGADARVDTGLHALGLPNLDRDRPLSTLSGGERSRLSLAATLADAPELLLLDEPTNDLDDSAVAWLEGRLLRHRGTVLAVTHDRAFLARITDTVLEVDHETQRVHRYGNGYDGYLGAKAAERLRRIREYEDWRHELARQRRLVDNNAVRLHAIPRKAAKAAFGHGAFKLRGRDHGARGRIRIAKERVQRLTREPVPPPPIPLRMDAVFTAAGQEGPGAAALSGVRVGGRLRVPDLTVGAGERVLVTGPNGAGKTTLLHLMAHRLRPDAGTVSVPAWVGLLRQEDAAVQPGRTVLQAYAAGLPGVPEDHREGLAALGLFRIRDLDRPLADLSAGQRRRVEVARLTSGAHGLLLLDEPTNHLSPGLVEDLEEALGHYSGALVVVSHDRRLRERFEGRHLVLRGGEVVMDTVTHRGGMST